MKSDFAEPINETSQSVLYVPKNSGGSPVAASSPISVSPSKLLVSKYNPFNKRHLRQESPQGRATLGSPQIYNTGAELLQDPSRMRFASAI